MKLLITGGTGYIGSALVRYLRHTYPRNAALRLLVRSPGIARRLFPEPDIELVQGNIEDALSVERAAAGIDVVFHVAGLVSFEQIFYRKLYRMNVEGTRQVVNACLVNGVKRLIHTSSTAAVGSAGDGKLSTEKTQFQDWQRRIGYMVSKYLGEMEVLRGVAEGLDAVIINPGIVFGNATPGNEVQDRNALGNGAWKPAHQSPGTAMLTDIFKGKLPYYPVGGAGMVDIDDVVRAQDAAWRYGETGERYSIVSENLTYESIFRTIALYPHARSRAAEPVGKWVGRMAGAGAELWGALTGITPTLTLDSVRAAERTLFYDNAKSVRDLKLRYRPFRETIERTLAENGLKY